MTTTSLAWSPATLRITAVASMLSALSTLILIFGGELYPTPENIAERVALLTDPWFRLRSWTYYLHPFLVFTAALGVWRITRQSDAGLAAFGIIGFAIWGYTEALQQALALVARNWNWLAAWPASDAATRAAIAERVDMFYGLWDGLYFLLLSGFLIGSFCLGLALARGAMRDRWVGWLLLAIALLSVGNFIVGYGGPAWLGGVLDIAYPALQPAIRLATGVWLWRRALSAG